MPIFQHGKVLIRDQGSSLGTYVNGHRLDEESPELNTGYSIAIG